MGARAPGQEDGGRRKASGEREAGDRHRRPGTARPGRPKARAAHGRLGRLCQLLLAPRDLDRLSGRDPWRRELGRQPFDHQL
jgi:hypothetical protein